MCVGSYVDMNLFFTPKWLVFINLTVVISPSPFFEKANGGFSTLLGFSWLAVFIWLPLNVNRVYSGVLSLIFGEQTCFILFVVFYSV